MFGMASLLYSLFVLIDEALNKGIIAFVIGTALIALLFASIY